MKTNQLGPGGVSNGFFVGLVSPPIFPTKKLKSEKIHSGEIKIGENIVEKEYKKLVPNELGGVMTQTFSVHGRKHSLSKL